MKRRLRTEPSRSPALGGKKGNDQGDAPQLGGDAVLTHLMAAMQDADPAVRERALEALEKIGGERALDLLITSSRDQDGSVRRRAFSALSRLQGENIAAALRVGLDDPDEVVRHSAAAGLGRQRRHRDIDVLRRVMFEDEDIGVRAQAALALAEIGDPRVADDLGFAVIHYPYYPHQRAYGEALRRLYEQHPQPVADAMVRRLLDPEADHRRYIFDSVFRQVEPLAAIPALIDVMLDKTRPVATRRKALWGMAPMLNPVGAKAYLTLIQDSSEDDQLRTSAVLHISKISSPEINAALIDVLIEGGRMWNEADRGLHWHGYQNVIPLIIPLLEHDDWKVRRRAMNILSDQNIKDAIPGMLRNMNHPQAEVRAAAIRALTHLEYGDARPLFIHALRDDKSAAVRQVAAKGLSAFSDAETLQMLAAALDDPAQDVRETAVLGLITLCKGNPKHFNAIREMILPYRDDPNGRIRHLVDKLFRAHEK